MRSLTFTSYESSPEPGDYYGLTVEYAGGHTSCPTGVFLYYTQADSPLITNSVFQYNAGQGLYAYYYSYTVITDSVFQDNDAYGAYSITKSGNTYTSNASGDTYPSSL
jgi:hypothetical protein